ncbi:ribulose 1,5-bisphosphate carboxylase [Litorivicinus lipolyticus]|uniref:Ribulose 1,5-bisphosphate carboxylase n=1 Tax=Litorivicinus lipolyticus TaxID=418701 RepID=A0A5Q2QC21_9GAMM|nr:ribulose-bisphosphate carboxylase large subunit family protein [Litorivicinus lipolyticus]QGG79537.1 ribulose 1,5-bisphosphate carboxylase [Litorivicinus lipolyticus]
MRSERFEADYLVQTPEPIEHAAAVIAGEQSSGTFIAVPNETPELKERSAARVEHIEVLAPATGPALPGRYQGSEFTQARVTLSWPLDNIGADLPNLIATVAGNLFELQGLSGLRLLDVRLPDAFASVYPGPKFGVSGTRALSGVDQGPLIGTIIKPSVGLDPAQTAQLVTTLIDAGIDFIKDDELQCDGPRCPFDARAEAVMAVINRHADATGKKVMYAFNVTGEVDQMRRRHDQVQALGGSCVMASLNSVGMTGFLGLSRHSQLPIHAHRNGWGYLSRSPMLGWDYRAWSKLWRIAGADHLHVNGLDNKFSEDNDSVMRSAQSLSTPIFSQHPQRAMAVFSSGQSVKQIEQTYQRLGHADLIYAAGGGIMGHPDGPGAGVSSLREGWHAAMRGIPIATHAQQHPALVRALDAYQ